MCVGQPKHNSWDTQQIGLRPPPLPWCILRCIESLASAPRIDLCSWSFIACTDGQMHCLSRQTDSHLPAGHCPLCQIEKGLGAQCVRVKRAVYNQCLPPPHPHNQTLSTSQAHVCSLAKNLAMSSFQTKVERIQLSAIYNSHYVYNCK